MDSPTLIFNPPKLSIHKESRMVTKVKPKIRIIHIFAPEIIKTDVENFREIVQRLTGKPQNPTEQSRRKKKKSTKIQRFSHQEGMVMKNIDHLLLHHHHDQDQKQQQTNLMNGDEELSFRFPEINGFLHNDSSEITLLPVDDSHHHLLPFEQWQRVRFRVSCKSAPKIRVLDGEQVVSIWANC